MILPGACDTPGVKITGTIRGLDGTVRLLAEMPGEKGFTMVAQQEVQGGQLDLRTEQLVLPAQVWIDFRGRRMLELILDSQKGTFIEGEVDSVERLKITGSSLMERYTQVMHAINEKFGPDIENYNERILEISRKENLTRDDEMKLGKHQLDRQRVIGRRADYVKLMIKSNLTQDLSLFLLKNELMDSVSAQKKLFHSLAISNKESNIYK
ncbi:MAG: hypothetical protein LBK12_03510, partial [Odoribacteraceae bacterium]|nr:hypothetical protein [Odoribacteraceae bacterium]